MIFSVRLQPFTRPLVVALRVEPRMLAKRAVFYASNPLAIAPIDRTSTTATSIAAPELRPRRNPSSETRSNA